MREVILADSATRPPPFAKRVPVLSFIPETQIGSVAMMTQPVTELLEIDDAMRSMIRAGEPANSLRAQARKSGMLYLQDASLQKVITGVTSMTEVLRVMRDEEPPRAKK